MSFVVDVPFIFSNSVSFPRRTDTAGLTVNYQFTNFLRLITLVTEERGEIHNLLDLESVVLLLTWLAVQTT